MSKNFIDDGTTDLGDLPATKTDGERIIDPTTQVTAQDINILVQALKDTRARYGGVGIATVATQVANGLMSAIDKAAFDHGQSRANVLDYGALPDTILARATITCVAANSLTAGQIFTLGASSDSPQAFRIRKAGDGLTLAACDVFVTPGESAIRTALRIAAAIQFDNWSKFRCDAQAVGDGTIALVSHAIGDAGNCTNTTNTSMTVGNFTGGVTGTDNRTAFLAAIAAAQTDIHGVKEIYIPRGAGHYLIKCDAGAPFATTGKIRFVGDGMFASGIMLGNTGASPNVNINSLVTPSYAQTGDGSFESIDLCWSGPTGNITGHLTPAFTGAYKTGLEFSEGNMRVAFTRSRVRNFSNNPLFIDPNHSVIDLVITDSWISGQGNGVFMSGPGAAGIPSSSLTCVGTNRIECVNSTLDDFDNSKGHGLYCSPDNNYSVGAGTTISGGFSGFSYSMTMTAGSGYGNPTKQDFTEVVFTGGRVNVLVGHTDFRPTLKNCIFVGKNCESNVALGAWGANLIDCTYVGDNTGWAAVTGWAIGGWVTTPGVSVLVDGATFLGPHATGHIYQAVTQTKPWVARRLNFGNSQAPAWAPGTVYALGARVTNDSGKLYLAVVAGTSAGSGGPTGTEGAIDNTVTWAYAGADCTALNLVIQDPAVTAGDITIADTVIPSGVFTNLGEIYAGSLVLSNFDASAVTSQFLCRPTGGPTVKIYKRGVKGDRAIYATGLVSYPEVPTPSTATETASKVTPTGAAGLIVPFAAASGLTGDDILIAGQNNDHWNTTAIAAAYAAIRRMGGVIDEPMPTANLAFEAWASSGPNANGAGIIDTWTDLAASPHNLTPIVSPSLISDSINGRPVSRWVAASSHQMKNDSFAVLDGLAHITTYMVIKPVSTTPLTFPYGCNQRQSAMFIFGDNLYGSAGTGTGHVAYTALTPAIITLVYDGTLGTDALRLVLRVNGVPQALTFDSVIPATVSSGAGISLGTQHGTTSFFDGDVAMVAIYSATDGAATIAAKEALLARQYGIALP